MGESPPLNILAIVEYYDNNAAIDFLNSVHNIQVIVLDKFGTETSKYLFPMKLNTSKLNFHSQNTFPGKFSSETLKCFALNESQYVGIFKSAES